MENRVNYSIWLIVYMRNKNMWNIVLKNTVKKTVKKSKLKIQEQLHKF